LSEPDSATVSMTFAQGDSELVIAAIRHPHTGRRILSLEEKIRSAHARPFGAVLSNREQEVLEWLEQCKSNAEMALILGISEHTVRHHIERIFVKLGVENRRAAMTCAQGARTGARDFISRVPDLAASLG
jgi:DNA-binding CsgD family transcriptional regulator